MTATRSRGSVSATAIAARRPAPPPPTTSTSWEKTSMGFFGPARPVAAPMPGIQLQGVRPRRSKGTTKAGGLQSSGGGLEAENVEGDAAERQGGSGQRVRVALEPPERQPLHARFEHRH